MGMTGHDTSFTQAQYLFAEFPAWRLSFRGSIATGLAVIMLMACSPQRLTRPMYSLIVAALLMATGWVFRWIIFMEAQEVPKYGAGLYLYKMPMGSDGLLGMLGVLRSEEHTSELQSLMRLSYAVFCLKKKKNT